MVKEVSPLEIERNVGNFAYPETHTHDAGVGLTEKTIHYISDIKEDPGLGPRIPPQRLQDFPEQADADALGEQGSGSDRFR